MSVHKVCIMHTLCTLRSNFTVKCSHKLLDSPVKHTVCSAENRKYRPLQFSLLISTHVYHQHPMCTTPKVVCTDPPKVCTKPEKCAQVCTVCTVCSGQPADALPPSLALTLMIN